MHNRHATDCNTAFNSQISYIHIPQRLAYYKQNAIYQTSHSSCLYYMIYGTSDVNVAGVQQRSLFCNTKKEYWINRSDMEKIDTSFGFQLFGLLFLLLSHSTSYYARSNISSSLPERLKHKTELQVSTTAECLIQAYIAIYQMGNQRWGGTGKVSQALGLLKSEGFLPLASVGFKFGLMGANTVNEISDTPWLQMHMLLKALIVHLNLESCTSVSLRILLQFQIDSTESVPQKDPCAILPDAQHSRIFYF